MKKKEAKTEIFYLVLRCKICNRKISELKEEDIIKDTATSITTKFSKCWNISIATKSSMAYKKEIIQNKIFCQKCKNLVGCYCSAVSSNRLDYSEAVILDKIKLEIEFVPESKITQKKEISFNEFMELNEDYLNTLKKGMQDTLDILKYVDNVYVNKLEEVIENNKNLKKAQILLQKYFNEIYLNHNQNAINNYKDFLKERANSKINIISENQKSDKNLKKKNK